MRSTIIDYEITALLVIYWTVMAVWLVLMGIDIDIDRGPVPKLAAAALTAGVGWHPLRRERKKLQEKTKALQRHDVASRAVSAIGGPFYNPGQ